MEITVRGRSRMEKLGLIFGRKDDWGENVNKLMASSKIRKVKEALQKKNREELRVEKLQPNST